MKILLTGANGYIGSRLIPLLLKADHELYLLVRDPNRLRLSDVDHKRVHIIQGDLLKPETLKNIPKDLDAAYYLVHSMSKSSENFDTLDLNAARNFIKTIDQSGCKQIIYLSGLQN